MDGADGGITWVSCDDDLEIIDDYNGDVYRAPIFFVLMQCQILIRMRILFYMLAA